MSRQRGVNRVRSFAEVADPSQHVSVGVYQGYGVADLAYVCCYPKDGLRVWSLPELLFILGGLHIQ